jgi:hypothetical protein
MKANTDYIWRHRQVTANISVTGKAIAVDVCLQTLRRGEDGVHVSPSCSLLWAEMQKGLEYKTVMTESLYLLVKPFILLAVKKIKIFFLS